MDNLRLMSDGEFESFISELKKAEEAYLLLPNIDTSIFEISFTQSLKLEGYFSSLNNKYLIQLEKLRTDFRKAYSNYLSHQKDDL